MLVCPVFVSWVAIKYPASKFWPSLEGSEFDPKKTQLNTNLIFLMRVGLYFALGHKGQLMLHRLQLVNQKNMWRRHVNLRDFGPAKLFGIPVLNPEQSFQHFVSPSEGNPPHE
jgi:hypothetical protein